MLFKLIALLLIFLILTIGFLFGIILKYYNYELNYKECLLYFIPILLITIFGLIDYNIIKNKFIFYSLILLVCYSLIMLIIYYIIRFIKLKKYIPYKIIIGYTLISVVNIIILFNIPADKLQNISRLNIFLVVICYILISAAFIISLLTFNTIFLIFSLISNNVNKYNKKYRISKISYTNILTIPLLIFLIFVINNYNSFKYDILVKEQKNVVLRYLNKKYPNYQFEIIDINETGIKCGKFGCSERGFNNKVLNKNYNLYFSIYVTKENLTIYEDEFQDIMNEKLKE